MIHKATHGTYMLPDMVKAELDEFVKTGRPQGSFTMAVLRNDLRGAYQEADTFSLEMMHDIVRYCWWELPAGCWGSEDNVEHWIDKGGLEQTEETQEDAN